MSEYIHETVIPIMVQERFAVKPEDEQYEAALQCIYCEYGLKKNCPSTIYKWLKLLGFRYEPKRMVTTLMGMKSQKQSAIETNTWTVTYYTSV
jgi:hypothetical protein